MSALPEYISEADSEASDTESPHFVDVASVKVSQEAPGGAGTTPMEEAEAKEEEEEKENPDVYFKQKRKG